MTIPLWLIWWVLGIGGAFILAFGVWMFAMYGATKGWWRIRL